MKLKKINPSKGRMTFRQELASYFSTQWTLEDGKYYLDCVGSLSSENKELIKMLQTKRSNVTEVADDNKR